MHGDALRRCAGSISLPPGIPIPLAAVVGAQSAPLLLAAAPGCAGQSLVCCRSPGAMPLPLSFVTPNRP
jgi:hypothetical protein